MDTVRAKVSMGAKKIVRVVAGNRFTLPYDSKTLS